LEAVEHEGPGRYDLPYLDYLEALLGRADAHGLDVLIDFHQDVWSRFTGGDGAPRWTLEAVGFDVGALHATGAAFLEAEHPGPLPKMIWPTNATKLGAATMATLFFGGETFAPSTRVDGENAQTFLQEHFFKAVEQVVRRAAKSPAVFGVDLFNEPFAGYIGCLELEKPAAIVEVGAIPSPLESFALGMGRALRVRRFHRGLLGPRVVAKEWINRDRRKAWRGAAQCIWLEHGVWEDRAVPRVAKPRYFAQVDGRRVSFARDFLDPFLVEGARRIHALAPELVVMGQGEPFKDGPRFEVPGPVAWSPHWYDGYVLFMKDFRSFLAADAFTQKPVFGAGRIRKSFAAQLGRLVEEARERDMPLLIGELGIAFDLGKRARPSVQGAAMNRTLTAVEDAQVSATIWNYTADHSRARGDGWNGEDLSIFSRETTGADGGRALHAVVRPRPIALAGRPVKYGFDLATRRFELGLERDLAITAPSTFFVPTLHYPEGARLEVSSGTVAYDPAAQRASWTHDSTSGVQMLAISPR
jgi:hypothetical protein